jgi:hypothetical protein
MFLGTKVPDTRLTRSQSAARLAWRSFQAAILALGVLEHLCIGRATSGSFLVGKLPALGFHLALVKAHDGWLLASALCQAEPLDLSAFTSY